jgi:hypothetical protein
MVRAAAGAPVPDGHAPSDADVKITVVRASGATTGDVHIGDAVALSTTKGYLARVVGSSSQVGYLPSPATITPEATWTLVLRSNGGAGSTINVGTTEIALQQVVNGANRYLQNSSGTLQVLTTLGTSANFKLTWQCSGTDTCGSTR